MAKKRGKEEGRRRKKKKKKKVIKASHSLETQLPKAAATTFQKEGQISYTHTRASTHTRILQPFNFSS